MDKEVEGVGLDMNFKEFYLIEKKDVEYDYSSVQLNFDEEIADKIMQYSSEIPDEYIYTEEDDPSYGREDEIHTTILYGLDAEEPDEVVDLMKDVKPFEVNLGNISYFELEEKEYNVMKVEVESEELHALNKKLRDNVSYNNDFPDYKPHLTVAYIKKDFPKDDVDVELFKDLTQTVDEIIFSSKNGTETSIKLVG